MDHNLENIEIEIKLLLEAIYMKYGYDYREYSKSHIKRRLLHFQNLKGYTGIINIIEKILYDKSLFFELIQTLSINITQMFRDPSFYEGLRKFIFPEFENLNFLKIWNAGCASGEEVYSVLILLDEFNYFNKAQIYATDINDYVLETAEKGIFKSALLKNYEENYKKSGGKKEFNTYFTVHEKYALLKQKFKKNILFTRHNLVTDASFNEMNIILCRNVMIYFNKELQDKVIGLFYESLPVGGILCLGLKESLNYTKYCNKFEEIVKGKKIYRKVK